MDVDEALEKTVVIAKIQQLQLQSALALILSDEYYIDYPDDLVLEALTTNVGKGRGSVKNNERAVYPRVDVYEKHSTHSRLFTMLVHMDKQEFDTLSMKCYPTWLNISFSSYLTRE